MNKTVQRGQQKEIGKIKLSDNQELVITLVDNEKLDLRIFLKSDSYTGPTKRGIRFYIFDGVWEKVFELLKTFNKEFEKMA